MNTIKIGLINIMNDSEDSKACFRNELVDLEIVERSLYLSSFNVKFVFVKENSELRRLFDNESIDGAIEFTASSENNILELDKSVFYRRTFLVSSLKSKKDSNKCNIAHSEKNFNNIGIIWRDSSILTSLDYNVVRAKYYKTIGEMYKALYLGEIDYSVLETMHSDKLFTVVGEETLVYHNTINIKSCLSFAESKKVLKNDFEAGFRKLIDTYQYTEIIRKSLMNK